MVELNGKGVCAGIARGPLFFMNKASAEVKKRDVHDTVPEIARLNTAVDEAVAQLKKLQEKTEKSADKNSAMIFEIHQMMLADPDFIGSIERYIAEGSVCAEYAVYQVSKDFAKKFREMYNPYMQ